MNPKKPLTIIGRAEMIELIGVSRMPIPAKVDTGADISSIWVSHIGEQSDGLVFTLFGPRNHYYTGEKIHIPHNQYHLTRIANSFGQRELRYVVKMRVKVKGRVIKATFSLADRSLKTYPVLLGRRFLRGKFLVDVSQGRPLFEEEKAKKMKMLSELPISVLGAKKGKS